MTENNLFQLAQVVSDLSPMEHRIHQRRTLPLRKNACAVCAVCFTCSKSYATTCTCDELQPRRGKNLPENGLDSRAKKLNKTDKQDYDFTIRWLQDHAHSIYRDERNRIIGLEQQAEVGLCKAHSSTLYRAKKRWEREHRSSSPMDLMDRDPPSSSSSSSSMGGIARKIQEFQYNQPAVHNMEPDLTMTPSTSYKRKRIDAPQASASTPIFASGPLMKAAQHSMSSPPMSFQLPPLHQTPPSPSPQPPSSVSSSLNTLSSSLQHQLYLTPKHRPNMLRHPSPHHHPHPPHHLPPPTPQSPLHQQPQPMHPPHHSSPSTPPLATPNQQQHSPTSPLPSLLLPVQHPQVETVSLKSMPSDDPTIYFIRNLAITDTFTFRHLLDETDITDAPPPGKRIIITDTTNDRIFPLSQAIRSVLPNPSSTHVEFCLGLTDKAPFDWSSCA
ncbi:hypothetical protein DM01DRAFT_1349225 [Hesseltinella vesiculosa]|uniref:Uncharacterized protein n=1 Tax=Hesseltinella vesiculosa TaxID=101127 RepID=A0A1X2G5W0_9FUNG|nr:hypothetical protein DM01DRAFT_1349225 [Hesseltinella vesiculosa]